MGIRQSEQLSQLFKRFEEDTPFADDPGIGADTFVFKRGSFIFGKNKKPFVVISNAGIKLRNSGFYAWNEISHEGVVTKAFTTRKRGSNARGISGSRDSLFFICPDGHVEVPMATLAIRPSALDYLLTLYRWRYGQHSGCTTGIK